MSRPVHVGRLLVALFAVVLSPACSFILDSDPAQCTENADCRRFDTRAICVDSTCVLPDAGSSAADAGPPDAGPPDAGPPDAGPPDAGPPDAGPPDAGPPDAGPPDAGPPDAGPPDAGPVDSGSGLGPPGCGLGAPDADIDFFNRCTTSSYKTFDNCARAGLCGDAGEPAVFKPDGGISVPTTAVDAGFGVYCYDATAGRTNVVFMNGSTNFTPFIRTMTPIVEAAGYTIVWQQTSSCTGADTAFNVDPTRRVMKNPVNSGQSFAQFFTSLPDGGVSGTNCLLGTSPNAPNGNQEYADIGQSDIYADSCPQTSSASPFSTYQPGSTNFPDVKHYLGPVQSMVFVVPNDSSQEVISAEAARIIFGIGGNGVTVPPWTEKNFMWVRSGTTGTAGIIARGIGLPATELWGIDQRSAGQMVSQVELASTTDAEKIIGLLSIDFADKEKNNLRMLYYQPRGALAGYLPDMERFTRDKENVRDGHYPLWGPIHLYARAAFNSTTGLTDISAGAKAFISNFTVSKPAPELLNAMIDSGNVPGCAMKVARSGEMTPLRSYEAPFQCHCYYEHRLNGGGSCRPCSTPSDCIGTGTPACNLGYCEKK